MANLLKFYRGASAPSTLLTGTIWFNTAEGVIKVYNGTEWETYGTKPVDLEAVVTRVKALEDNMSNYVAKTTTIAGVDLQDSITVEELQSALGLQDAAYATVASLESTMDSKDAQVKTDLIGDATAEGDTLGKLEDRIEGLVSDAKTYSIAKVTEGLVENVKEAYKLVDEDGTQVGETINIYKDSSLISVELVDEKPAETEGAEATKGQFIKYTYVLANGEESTQYVDVSRLLVEAEFKDGLQVSTAGEVSVKVDEASESYLTVGADGVKLSGVTQAITDAVAAEAAIARAAEQANADAIATVASDLAAEVTRATAAEAAIATDLATLDAEVQEHEIVTASALIDLNARVKGVEDGVVEINEVIKNLDFGVTSVTATTSSAHVTVAPTTAASGEVSLTVDVASVDAAEGGAAGLATDAYVREQVAASALCWMEGSF